MNAEKHNYIYIRVV